MAIGYFRRNKLFAAQFEYLSQYRTWTHINLHMFVRWILKVAGRVRGLSERVYWLRSTSLRRGLVSAWEGTHRLLRSIRL